jgi:ATP-dependent helicase/nuclease subunit A
LGASRDNSAIFADLFGGSEGAARRRTWRAALGEGGANDQKAAAKLREAEAAMADLSAATEKLFAVFLSEGRPRKKVATSKVDKGVALALQQEAERVKILRDELSDVATIARSVDLFRLAKAVAEGYRRAKERKGALDFTDLTTFARGLLERESAAWVLYKLDSGIDHILVDEAQDTSADQWKIIEALSKDWLSGAGRGGHRTLFAVGDEKQSIFSFNGARPELLDANRRFYAAKHQASDRPFEPIDLKISFRSATVVLDAVDRVIGQFVVWHQLIGSTEPAPIHEAAKRDPAGRVELWPVLAHVMPKAPVDWLVREGGAPESGPGVSARRSGPSARETS